MSTYRSSSTSAQPSEDVQHTQNQPFNLKDGEVSMGTSIMAVTYRDGVILGADTRTSTGSYIANRATDKITPLADKVYILRSGSAADTQALASYVQFYIASHQAENNSPVTTKAAANMAMQMAYSNKDMLQVSPARPHALLRAPCPHLPSPPACFTPC